MKQESQTGILPISIIIPTYCEEKLLPLLLDSIAKQKMKPLEVIVADAQSPDKTREIAKSYGAIVVEGGRVAVGRNAGARIARGEYLLFMDADSYLPTEITLGEAFLEYLRNEVDVASAEYVVGKEDLERSAFNRSVGRVLLSFFNIIRNLQNVIQKPRSVGGAFIFVKKKTFGHIGGFDEKIALCEDDMLYQKAVNLGYKYRNLGTPIVTSVRRFDTPKKAFSLIGYVLFQSVIVGLGFYAGAKFLNKTSKMYGNLGGGAGKPPAGE